MTRFLKNCMILYIYAVPCLLFPDALSLSGSPSVLTINSAIAGQQPNSVTNTSTTYSVTTTILVKVITGKIQSNMPSGVTLQVSLAAPAGATSLGLVSMTSVAQNLVTGIPTNTTANVKTVTYSLSATVNAAQVSNATKTLTLTLQ